MSSKKRSSSQTSVLGMFIGSLIVYWIFSRWWNPVDFHPFSYMNLGKGAPVDLLLLMCLIAPFILGQLHWISPRRDDDLVQSVTSYPWLAKVGISAYAGLFEELTFRSVAIYTAMISIALMNKFFALGLALLFIVITLLLMAKTRNGVLNIIILIGAIVAYIVILNKVPADPWYYFYRHWYVPVYSSLFALENRADILKVFLAFAVVDIVWTLGMKMFAGWMARNGDDWSTRISGAFVDRMMTPASILSSSLLTLGLAVYAYWMITYTNAFAIFEKPEMLVWAIISCAISFQQAHKGQNLVGLLNKIVFSFFMMYIAFTYGLWYAILGHFMYDVMYFTSEHIVYMFQQEVRMKWYYGER